MHVKYNENTDTVHHLKFWHCLLFFVKIHIVGGKHTKELGILGFPRNGVTGSSVKFSWALLCPLPHESHCQYELVQL